MTYIGTVTCRFASIKVEVKFSEDIPTTDPSSTVEVNAGTGTLTWSTTETRYGYFVPTNDDNKTIGATFRGKVNDKEIVVSKTVDNAAIGSYYIFTFSLEKGDPFFPGETGTVTTPEENNGIVIDLEVIEEDVEQVVTPDPDIIDKDDTEHPDYEEWPDENTDPVDPDKPDKPNTGNESVTIEPDKEKCKDLNLDGGVNPVVDGATYIINIHADNGIENLKVNIQSTNDGFIESAGELLPMEFDLAHLDDTLYENLKSIGLEGNAAVLDKTDVPFDITELVPMLLMFEGTHTFVISVTDKEGNSLILQAE